MSVEVGLRPNLEFDVYEGLANVAAGIDGGVEAGITANLWEWSAEAALFLDVFAEAELSFWGLLDEKAELRYPDLARHVIASHGGPMVRLQVTPDPVTVPVGGSAQATARAISLFTNRDNITRHPKAVSRVLIALKSDEPWETLLDAYVLDGCLITVCGDLSIREFPQKRLPAVRHLSLSAFSTFDLDPSGSFLYWPEIDAHLGPSQMLQAADPMYLADVEIQRYGMEKISTALLQMREERGLTQSDIEGLSERQVRGAAGERRVTAHGRRCPKVCRGLWADPRRVSRGAEPETQSAARHVG